MQFPSLLFYFCIFKTEFEKCHNKKLKWNFRLCRFSNCSVQSLAVLFKEVVPVPLLFLFSLVSSHWASSKVVWTTYLWSSGCEGELKVRNNCLWTEGRNGYPIGKTYLDGYMVLKECVEIVLEIRNIRFFCFVSSSVPSVLNSQELIECVRRDNLQLFYFTNERKIHRDKMICHRLHTSK